jgi:hypothetical protein
VSAKTLKSWRESRSDLHNEQDRGGLIDGVYESNEAPEARTRNDDAPRRSRTSPRDSTYLPREMMGGDEGIMIP